MTTAIRPPEAIVPYRNNTESFSADSPTEYSGQTDDVNPPNPVTGRVNNHGFEGLTASRKSLSGMSVGLDPLANTQVQRMAASSTRSCKARRSRRGALPRRRSDMCV